MNTKIKKYTLKEAEAELKRIKRKKQKNYIDALLNKKVFIGSCLCVIGIVFCILNYEDATSGVVIFCMGLGVISSRKGI